MWQVAALKAQIESSFRAFAGRDLRVFFDTHEIAGMDDWRQKIQRSFARLAGVSRRALTPLPRQPTAAGNGKITSATKPCANASAKASRPSFSSRCPTPPIRKPTKPSRAGLTRFSVARPSICAPGATRAKRRCSRHTSGKRWNDSTLPSASDWTAPSVRPSSPNNLIKHNPAFVGRARELTELRHALTKNKLGVVGAHEGQTPPQRSTIASQHPEVVQGLGGIGKTELALACPE
jgi:hypothetical protein